MKRKSMFLRVFFECFNQLKLPGIIFLSMWALGYSFAFYIGSMDSLSTTAWLLYYGYILFAILIIPIATLVFAFKAFNFLFKRKSCDFYHALPIKRHNLFFANSLACFSWIAIILVLPLITVLLHSISFLDWNDISPIFTILLKNTSKLFIYTFGICIMTISVTGLRIPAIINTFVLVLLPNVCYYVFRNGLFSRLPFLVESAPNTLPSTELFFFGIGDTEFDLFYFIAGLIYYGLGLLFFVKRKSETAEKSAPNKFLKTIYCALAGFALSIISNSLIILDNNSSWIFICYGLAVIICFTYEFLTEKGVKAIKRALISTAVLILINVMFLGSFYSIEAIYKHKRIEIASFRPVISSYKSYTGTNERTQEPWGEFYPEVNCSYGSLMVKDYFITDENACEALEEILAEVSQASEHTNQRFLNVQNQKLPSTVYCFTIKDTRGKTHYRNIPLYKSEYESLIIDVLNAQDSEFCSLVTQLPEKEEISTAMIKQYDNLAAGEINLNDLELYDLFVEEYSKLSPRDRVRLLYKAPSVIDIPLKTKANIAHTIILTLEGKHLNRDFKSLFIIDGELMPNTFKAALTLMDGNRQQHFSTLKEVFATSESIEQASPFKISIEYDTRFEKRPQLSADNITSVINISDIRASVDFNAVGHISEHVILNSAQGAEAIGFITDKILPTVNGYNCKIYFQYTTGNGRTLSHYLTGYILPADYELICDYIRGLGGDA